MTQASKPSAGALRAASEICEDGRWDEQVIAHIIDRETGLAKLLEAAELAKAELRYYPGEENKEGDALVDAAYSALQQAIAKAEQA